MRKYRKTFKLAVWEQDTGKMKILEPEYQDWGELQRLMRHTLRKHGYGPLLKSGYLPKYRIMTIEEDGTIW
jgi:hypothetical protein